MFLKVYNQIGKIHKCYLSSLLYSYIDQSLRHRVWNLNHQGYKDRSLESNFMNQFFQAFIAFIQDFQDFEYVIFCFYKLDILPNVELYQYGKKKTYLSKVHQNIPAPQSQ